MEKNNFEKEIEQLKEKWDAYLNAIPSYNNYFTLNFDYLPDGGTKIPLDKWYPKENESLSLSDDAYFLFGFWLLSEDTYNLIYEIYKSENKNNYSDFILYIRKCYETILLSVPNGNATADIDLYSPKIIYSIERACDDSWLDNTDYDAAVFSRSFIVFLKSGKDFLYNDEILNMHDFSDMDSLLNNPMGFDCFKKGYCLDMYKYYVKCYYESF